MTTSTDPAALLAGIAAAAPEQTRLAGEAILRSFAATGEAFSANDLRPHLVLAGVPTTLRGALTAALLNARVIVEVGTTRSTDPGTHGKRIGLYRGTRPCPAAALTLTCQSCRRPLHVALAAAGAQLHPACPAGSLQQLAEPAAS